MDNDVSASQITTALQQGRIGSDAAISLPNGVVVSAQRFKGFKHKIKDAKEFLSHPEVLLEDPKPGAHYGWPVRNPRTDGLIRGTKYRKISPSELKADSAYEIVTHEGVGGIGGHIEWYNHVLVEIDPDFWKEHYEAAPFNSLFELARRSDAFESEASAISPGTRTSVSATPIKG